MRMITQQRRSTVPLIACLVLALVLASSTLSIVNAQSSDSSSSSGSHGFFSAILSPLTSSLRHARLLLGAGSDETPVGSDSDNSTAAPSSNSGALGQLRERAFKMFARLYNKSYSAEELPRRMALFFARRKEIEASMRAYAEGRVPFMMRENAYVDWDERELKGLTGVAPPKKPDEMLPEDRQALMKAARALKRRRRSIDANETRSIAATTTLEADPMLEFDFGNETLHLDADAPDYEQVADGEFEDEDEDEEEKAEAEQSEDAEEEDLNLLVMAPEQIPAAKDWRTSGCVAQPINQQKCGACYAIATMGVLESMRCLNSVSSPTLAPQQVVDCSSAYNNFGCNGGWPTRVLKYLQDVGVASRESCYPFVRRQQMCSLRQVQRTNGCTVSASPTNTRLTYKVLNNERDILYHVAKTGPVITVMRATDKFLYYGSGIFDDATCTRRRDDVDHAIVIVGYGRQNGQDYWLIKNSWGTSWGQAGYGLYKRGTNACSIGHWGWVITS